MIEGLPKKLQDLRRVKDLSQKEVADMLMLTKGSVSNYENGISTPNVITLAKLAQFYSVTIDYLVGLETQETIAVNGLTKGQRKAVEELVNKLCADNKAAD